jgi:hypothetical protein
MKSNTCHLTTRSHHCPPSLKFEATTPAAPNDHKAIHKSTANINTYDTLITSGRFQTIFTAFCRTNIVNGSLEKKTSHEEPPYRLRKKKETAQENKLQKLGTCNIDLQYMESMH